jgi:hypothetical protein
MIAGTELLGDPTTVLLEVNSVLGWIRRKSRTV